MAFKPRAAGWLAQTDPLSYDDRTWNNGSLTDFVLEITRSVKSATLKKAVEDFGLNKKWESTPFGKKLQRAATRSKLTDFDRFKVMVLRKKVIFIS